MTSPDPARLNLILPIGSDWEKDFAYRDPSENLVDLTSYTAKMQVRAGFGSTFPALLTLQTSDSTIILGGALGTIRLAVPSSVTVGLTPGNYYYDLELYDGTGKKTRLLEGRIVFTPEVTL